MLFGLHRFESRLKDAQDRESSAAVGAAERCSALSGARLARPKSRILAWPRAGPTMVAGVRSR